MKQNYRSWVEKVTHFQTHHLRVAFSLSRFPFKSTCEAETRTEKMKVSSWRDVLVISTVGFKRMIWQVNLHRFNKDWCIWCDFCGQGKLAQDFDPQKMSTWDPLLLGVPLYPAGCFTDGKGRLEELIFMEWDLWCSWVSFQNLSGWLGVGWDWLRAWVLKLLFCQMISWPSYIPNQIKK